MTTPGSAPSSDWVTQRATIINWLYLSGFVLGITSLVGVVLCYIWRSESTMGDWQTSHFDYHIRTFWFSLLGGVVGFLLMIILIGFLIWLAVAVWVVVRCVMSIQRCQRGEPMPDPTTLTW